MTVAVVVCAGGRPGRGFRWDGGHRDGRERWELFRRAQERLRCYEEPGGPLQWPTICGPQRKRSVFPFWNIYRTTKANSVTAGAFKILYACFFYIYQHNICAVWQFNYSSLTARFNFFSHTFYFFLHFKNYNEIENNTNVMT